MKFKIYYNDGIYKDNIIVTGNTVEDIRSKAAVELRKRGWSERDCWSEKLSG